MADDVDIVILLLLLALPPPVVVVVTGTISRHPKPIRRSTSTPRLSAGQPLLAIVASTIASLA